MSTSIRKVNTLIAGAGSAGITAFNELRRSGLTVLLCDGGPLGTTCARAGCMPSKALIEVSRKAHAAKALYENKFLSLDMDPQFNLPRVMQHVRHLRDHFTGMIAEQIKSYGSDFIQSHVHFLGPDQASTEDGSLIQFESAIVAVGSSPIVPPSFADQESVFTSDDIFDLSEPISSLDVIGCGVVGIELAQAISRLGVEVKVYCEDLYFNFLPDEEMNALYQAALKRDLSFVVGYEVHHTGNGRHFQVEDETHKYEACLLATGRKPNLETLKIGGSLEIPMDYGIKSPDLPFYFVGDANSINPTVHDAVMEGQLAASLIKGDSPIKAQPVRFQIVFTDPQVAILERKGSQGDLVSQTILLKKQGRLLLAGENYGCIKIFYEPETQIIRKAYIISSQAEHLAHYLYPFLQREARLRDLKNTTFYHPTVYEALNSIREDKMAKRNKKPFQSPKDKISDTKSEFFDRDYSHKVDYDTMNNHSRADILSQRENNRPRDSV